MIKLAKRATADGQPTTILEPIVFFLHNTLFNCKLPFIYQPHTFANRLLGNMAHSIYLQNKHLVAKFNFPDFKLDLLMTIGILATECK